MRGRFKVGKFAFGVNHTQNHFYGERTFYIALVHLNDQRNLVDVQVVFLEVLAQVPHTLGVGPQAVGAAVGHKHNAIYTAQNQFAAGIVKHLSRHGVEVKAGFKPLNGSQIQRQEVEEKGAFVFGG